MASERRTDTPLGRRLLTLRGLTEMADPELWGDPKITKTEEDVIKTVLNYGSSWDLTRAEIEEVLNSGVREALGLAPATTKAVSPDTVAQVTAAISRVAQGGFQAAAVKEILDLFHNHRDR